VQCCYHLYICFVGVWGIGLAARNTQLDEVPLGMDKYSWVLRSDGTIFHNGENIATVKESPLEGDVIVRQQ